MADQEYVSLITYAEGGGCFLLHIVMFRMKTYLFGNTYLCLTGETGHLSDDNLSELFLLRGLPEEDAGREKDTVLLEICFSDLTAFTERAVQIMDTWDYKLYESLGRRFIVYDWYYCRSAFGFYLDELDLERRIIYFNPDILKKRPVMISRFLSCCGFHRALLNRGSLVLHAGHVSLEGKSYLFAAPSGTGKTTQTRLWEKYAGALIINDDRALIGKTEGVWRAFGYASCGSSRICLNRDYPLEAVFVLEQGTSNRLCPMTESEKLKALLAGAEFYHWDMSEIDRVLKTGEALCRDIPVSRLTCLPGRGAVETALDWIRKRREAGKG